MLRITRGPHKQEVSLQVHQRPPLWRNRNLLVALSLAGILHLSALILFSVAEVKLADIVPIESPVWVIADTSSGGKIAVADRGRMALTPPPRPAAPIDDGEAIVKPLLPKRSWLRVQVSGPLASQTLLNSPHEVPSGWPPGEQRYRYAVQLDQPRGRIFWLVPLTESAPPQMEQLVRSLRFKSDPQGSLVVGEVDVILSIADAT